MFTYEIGAGHSNRQRSRHIVSATLAPPAGGGSAEVSVETLVPVRWIWQSYDIHERFREYTRAAAV